MYKPSGTERALSSNPDRDKRFFSSPKCPNEPCSIIFNGLLFFGVKRPGRDADHSSPSSSKVNNIESNQLLPLNAFIAWIGTNSHFSINSTAVVNVDMTATDTAHTDKSRGMFTTRSAAWEPTEEEIL
jgi:hypothetical protein